MKDHFQITNDEGLTIECDVLFSFENEENGLTYVIYTDNSVDLEGNVRVYASTLDPNEEETSLNPITTEKEWRMIEAILDEIQGEVRPTISPPDEGFISALQRIKNSVDYTDFRAIFYKYSIYIDEGMAVQILRKIKIMFGEVEYNQCQLIYNKNHL